MAVLLAAALVLEVWEFVTNPNGPDPVLVVVTVLTLLVIVSLLAADRALGGKEDD